ncbi:conjugal transfer/entry exclusion protein [Neobacillus ginsengisoli]|uniref:Flagellar protein FliT n=2 Tax=Neobacillus ginsengisoli TaxID=904295 RepID=A0ABT9XWC1_9BACI|nr:conjugal transfer/entry exclusion protein [Neobacillus ginsengisoli]
MAETIYKITAAMQHVLNDGDFEEFEKLLLARHTAMKRIDTFKADYPSYQYTTKETNLLKDTLQLDQCIELQLKEKMTKIQTILNQIKKNKQYAKIYQPYLKQTDGVFIDSKK